jgi:hypothetical protein
MRHPDGRPITAEELPVARALRGETVRSELQLMVAASGDERAIVTSAAPIVSSGRVVGAVAVWHDITDRKLTEAKIEHLSSFPQLNPNPVLEVARPGQSCTTMRASPMPSRG